MSDKCSEGVKGCPCRTSHKHAKGKRPDAAPPKEVMLELRPIDAGYHYEREKEVVALARARKKLNEAMTPPKEVMPNEPLQRMPMREVQPSTDVNGAPSEPPPSDAAPWVGPTPRGNSGPAAPPKERCENHSVSGVVAGQQCGLEKSHHGPCFYTGECSVNEMTPGYWLPRWGKRPTVAAPEITQVEDVSCVDCGTSVPRLGGGITYLRSVPCPDGLPGCLAGHGEPLCRNCAYSKDPPSDTAPVAVGCENCKTLEQWVHDLQSGMFIN
ncbi:hypothetical protein LCGC14_1839580, partial [marine sediment metagenome]